MHSDWIGFFEQMFRWERILGENEEFEVFREIIVEAVLLIFDSIRIFDEWSKSTKIIKVHQTNWSQLASYWLFINVKNMKLNTLNRVHQRH